MFQRFISAQIRFGALILCIVLSTVGGLALAADKPVLPKWEYTNGIGWPLIAYAYNNPQYGVVDLNKIALHGLQLPKLEKEKEQIAAANFKYFMGEYASSMGYNTEVVVTPDRKIKLAIKYANPNYQAVAIAKTSEFLNSEYKTNAYDRSESTELTNYIANWLATQFFEAKRKWTEHHPRMAQAPNEIARLIDMLTNPTPIKPTPQEFRPRTPDEAHRDARAMVMREAGVDPEKSYSQVADAGRLEYAKELYKKYYQDLLKPEFIQSRPNNIIPPFEETKQYVLGRLRMMMGDILLEYLRDFPEGSLYVSGEPLDYELARAQTVADKLNYFTIEYRSKDNKILEKFSLRATLSPEFSGEDSFLQAIYQDRIISSSYYTKLTELLDSVHTLCLFLQEKNSIERRFSRSWIDLANLRNQLDIFKPNSASILDWNSYKDWFLEMFTHSNLGGFRLGLLMILSVRPDFIEQQALAETKFDLNEIFELGFENSQKSYWLNTEFERRKVWTDFAKELQGIVPEKKEVEKPVVKPVVESSIARPVETKPSLLDSIHSFKRQKLGALFNEEKGGWSWRREKAKVSIRFSHLKFKNLYLYVAESEQEFKPWLAPKGFSLLPLVADFDEPTNVNNGIANLYIPVGYELKTIIIKSVDGKIIDPSKYTIEVGEKDAGLRVCFHDPSIRAITYRMSYAGISSSRMSMLTVRASKHKIHKLAEYAEEARLTELSERLLANPPKTGADLESMVKASSKYTEDKKKLVEPPTVSKENPFARFAPFIREPYLLGVCVEHNELLETVAQELDVSAEILPVREVIFVEVFESKMRVDAYTHASVLYREQGKEVAVLDGTSQDLIDSSLMAFWRDSVGLVKSAFEKLRSGLSLSKPAEEQKKPAEVVVDMEEAAARKPLPSETTKKDENKNSEKKNSEDKVKTQKDKQSDKITSKQEEAQPEGPTNNLDGSNPKFVEFVRSLHFTWEKMHEFLSRTKKFDAAISRTENPTRSLKVLSSLLRYLSGDPVYKSSFQDVAQYFRLDHKSPEFWPGLKAQLDSLNKQFVFLHDKFHDPREKIQKQFPFLSLTEIQSQHNYLISLSHILMHPLMQQRLAELPAAIEAYKPLKNPCQSKLIPDDIKRREIK